MQNNPAAECVAGLLAESRVPRSSPCSWWSGCRCRCTSRQHTSVTGANATDAADGAHAAEDHNGGHVAVQNAAVSRDPLRVRWVARLDRHSRHSSLSRMLLNMHKVLALKTLHL